MNLYDILNRALASAREHGDITPEQAQQASLHVDLWEQDSTR
jgi:hypothetical protein